MLVLKKRFRFWCIHSGTPTHSHANTYARWPKKLISADWSNGFWTLWSRNEFLNATNRSQLQFSKFTQKYKKLHNFEITVHRNLRTG